jgi:hypothetical protein
MYSDGSANRSADDADDGRLHRIGGIGVDGCGAESASLRRSSRMGRSKRRSFPQEAGPTLLSCSLRRSRTETEIALELGSEENWARSRRRRPASATWLSHERSGTAPLHCPPRPRMRSLTLTGESDSPSRIRIHHESEASGSVVFRPEVGFGSSRAEQANRKHHVCWWVPIPANTDALDVVSDQGLLPFRQVAGLPGNVLTRRSPVVGNY